MKQSTSPFSVTIASPAELQARLARMRDARTLGLDWLDALRVSGMPAIQGGAARGKISVSASIYDERTLVAGAEAGAGSILTSADAAWLIANGIAVGQADKVWGATPTVTTGATITHDLAVGGSLTDAYGAAVVFVKLRAIVLAATGIAGVANTTTVQLARPAANGVPIFSAVSAAAPALSAGGIYVWADPGAGVGVVAATADLVTVINSAGASAGYTIIFVGTSA